MALPKRIHYCWFGNGLKNELVTRCIESWKKYAPECEITEWNETNYDVTQNRYMREAYEARRWGFVSDFARLDIVYKHGGIYLDTDVELIRPIDELLAGDGFIGFERADSSGRYSINTGSGFGAEAGDPVIGTMRDIYKDLSFEREDGSLNLDPSPTYNTEALARLGLRRDNTLQRIGKITIYPSDYFCPVDWESHKRLITKNTYSIHHFDASWLTEEEKKRRRHERELDRIRHLPNRALISLLGDERYAHLKKILKRGRN
ncbi:MAG: glycosyltransferase [Eubacteriales bacterium]|jgi:mannosyltransferase OCH1-like enzyme